MRRTALTAALVPCSLVLAACTANTPAPAVAASPAAPSNANLYNDQLVARFKTAVASATALHVKGAMIESGAAVTIDLQLNRDGSAQGVLSENGATVPLIVTGGVTYIQMTSSNVAMATAGTGAEGKLAAQLLPGKWISSNTGGNSDLASELSGVTFASLTQQLTSGSDEFTYLGTTTLNGQRVAQYNDSPNGGSTQQNQVMSVPLTGTALPVEKTDGNGGAATFTWNKPTKISPPPASDILDLPAS